MKRRSLLHWTISTFAIYGLNDANRYPFFVPELIDRETLADRIAKGPLPVDKALGIATRRSS